MSWRVTCTSFCQSLQLVAVIVIGHKYHINWPGIECGMTEASVLSMIVCAQYPPKLPPSMTNVLDVFHDVYLTSTQFVSESCYQLLWLQIPGECPAYQLPLCNCEALKLQI